jgi:beta-glucanase (GH16 family)
MTRTFSRVLLSALVLALLATGAAFAQQCPTLVWSDEFDGSAVDTNKWEFQLGDGCAEGICGWGNNEEQYYKAENATVANGLLSITAKKERVQAKAYTSARMRTLNQGDFYDGYFEARLRLPVGQGYWSAFWMLPTDEIYGGWPMSGEIDIMENVGHEDATTHGTIHYGDPWPNNSFQGASYSLANGARFTDDFHTFAIEKTNNQIRWFVDGVLFSTKTAGDVSPHNWPFNERFHFILNVAVGGNWPGSPTAQTQFPQSMDVDYVRVYDTGFPYITGPDTVDFQAAGVTYSVGNASGTINWTVPSDATIVSGQGSSSITVDFGAASGDVVANVGGCGGSVLTRSVAVDPPLYFEYSFENFDDPENVSINNTRTTGVLTEVANPDPDGVNATANSGEYARNSGEAYDTLFYSTSMITDADAYVSREKMFYIDLYSPTPGTVFLLQLEDSSAALATNYPTGRHSRYQVVTTVANGWERVEIPFMDRPDPSVATGNVDQLVILVDPNSSSSTTIHFDNFDSMSTTEPGPGAVCGNDVQESGEDCDGADLGGATCVSLGFESGTLACDGACGFDTSSCVAPACEPAGVDCNDASVNCCNGCSGGKPGSRVCL